MSGISSTLSIAKTALGAQQYGLNVTGHNIANVNNPDYSRQNAEHISRNATPYAGFLFGTGVDISQIKQSVDQLLENRLTDEKSTLTAFKEAESYMNIIDGFFDKNSKSSMNNIISGYWNAWQDLSNKPNGLTERAQIYEQGIKVAEKFKSMDKDFNSLSLDITKEISSNLSYINSLSEKIANLNVEILKTEAKGHANDLRDERNSLIDGLGELITINVITQGNGSVLINAGKGSTLVNGRESYGLNMRTGQVMWEGSYGIDKDITDDIGGGKIGGLLDIRDDVLSKCIAQIGEMAKEMIWAMNYQHSQGVGLGYFSDTMTGYYSADESKWLSSFDFGNRIDYTKDLTIWTKDSHNSQTKYAKRVMDMGLSQASLTNWSGQVSGAVQSVYKMTVVEGGYIGDQIVTQTNSEKLAGIWSTNSGGVKSAIDKILAEQTLSVYGSSTGTHKIAVNDSGTDSIRSAASIANSLNKIKGVKAYASTTKAQFDLSALGASVEEGDTFKFSLYTDGYIHKVNFIIDEYSTITELETQFKNEFKKAVKEINLMNGNTDLHTDGLSLSSDKGATLGVQDFEIIDNAGVKLKSFDNFGKTKVSFEITTDGIPTTSTKVVIDLSDVKNVTDQKEVSSKFYSALSNALKGKPFTVEYDTTQTMPLILLRTTNGSNIKFQKGLNDRGNNAEFTIEALSGSSTTGAAGVTQVDFGFTGLDEKFITSNTTAGTSTLGFKMLDTQSSQAGTTAFLNEATYTGASSVTAAGMVGTITTILDSEMSILSDELKAEGLFGSSGVATTASSIITLGGDSGFQGFNKDDKISFKVDGKLIDYVVTSANATTDAGQVQLAKQLFNELKSVFVADKNYSFIYNNDSVSILKNKSLQDPIKITDFLDSSTNDAKLKVDTGTGVGTNEPQNDVLQSGEEFRDFTTSSLYSDKATIRWERLEKNKTPTGVFGYVEVEDVSTITLKEEGADTISFDILKGDLVEGNVIMLNTDEKGIPDAMDLKIFKKANSVNDLYSFKVIKGGKVGHEPKLGEDNLTIQWKSSQSSGSFEIKGENPPHTPGAPVVVEVDGMLLSFYDGTLFDGDVFTIATDDSGVPVSKNEKGYLSGEKMFDWHWTIDSFSDQFNKEIGGMRANTDMEGSIKLEASKTFFDLENIRYSKSNGFSEGNTKISVLNWEALNFKAIDFQLFRTSIGKWSIRNDTTGIAAILPEGGDDDGFKVDLTGDGIGDIQIDFAKKVYGEGDIKFDFIKHDATDINYAFGDNSSENSGVLAAMGFNTFFEGKDALSIGVNEKIVETKHVTAGMIDSKTGLIKQGDNKNSLAMTDVQHKSILMKEWYFKRGREPQSNVVSGTLDDYYNTMIGVVGVEAKHIKSSREYAQIMVNQIAEQRDSVSAVSLDEEMIKLMQYQHAFSAASKLLTIADEMLNVLIASK